MGLTGDIDGWIERAGRRARDFGVPDTVAVKVTRPGHPGGGVVLDFDGEHVIGQFIVWPNGFVDATALAVETDERFFRHAVVNEVSELDGVLEDLSRAMTKGEGGG